MTLRPPKVDLAPSVFEWFETARVTSQWNEKYKKAKRAVKMMQEVGPSHPSFCTHQMQNLKGPGGATIWNSYVENKTPQAWRMYWIREPDGTVYIVSIGPHDHEPGEQVS